jgi:hypothetical protein
LRTSMSLVSQRNRCYFPQEILSLLLMRALSVETLGQIAVGTKYLEAGREAILFQPAVNAASSASVHLLSMFRPIVIDVIDMQEARIFGFLTTGTSMTAVSLKHFFTKPLVVLLDRSP